MAMIFRSTLSMLALVATASLAHAQSGTRDGIGDLLRNQTTTPPSKAAPKAAPGAAAPAPTAEPAERDPREGDASYEQAKKLMQAIDAVLQDNATFRPSGSMRLILSNDVPADN